MEQKFGFAIIGAGMIAQIHAREIGRIQGARLVAVAGPSEEKAGSLAKQHNAIWFEDYRKMLEREDIHIVNICTPSGMHGEMAIAAARAGKHVIVEKPMEISLKKADLMIAEARNHGVKLSVISQHRFDESAMKIKQAIQAGKLGEIFLAEAAVNWYRSQAYYDSAQWRGTWELDGGGALINQSIHTLDLLLHFLGPVRNVKANMRTAGHVNLEVEDVVAAVVEFENRALCTIACTTAAYPGFSNRIELFGTRGSVILEADRLVARSFREDPEPIVVQENIREIASPSDATGASKPDSISGDAHYRQFLDFLDAIRHDREPLVNGAEGRKTLELVLAIYQSAKEDNVVYL